MYITFIVDDHIQVSRNLRLLAKEIPELKTPFGQILDAVQLRTASMFKAGGSNVAKAGAWPALAESTLRARKNGWGYYKQTPNNPGIMRWTGAAQDKVLKQATDSFGLLQHTAVSKKGFNYPLAHQKGSGRLPQRVIIDIDEATIAEMQRIFQKHVHDKIGMFGLQATG